MIESELILLLGSRANNIWTYNSDYDIFIVSDAPTKKMIKGNLDCAFHQSFYGILEFIFPFQHNNIISPSILSAKILNKPTEYSKLYEKYRESIFASVQKEVAKRFLEFLDRDNLANYLKDWRYHSKFKFIRYHYYMTSVLNKYPKTHCLLESFPSKEDHDFILYLSDHRDYDSNKLCSIVSQNIEQAKKAYINYFEDKNYDVPTIKSIRDKFLDLEGIDLSTFKDKSIECYHQFDRSFFQLDIENIPDFYFEK